MPSDEHIANENVSVDAILGNEFSLGALEENFTRLKNSQRIYNRVKNLSDGSKMITYQGRGKPSQT